MLICLGVGGEGVIKIKWKQKDGRRTPEKVLLQHWGRRHDEFPNSSSQQGGKKARSKG